MSENLSCKPEQATDSCPFDINNKVRHSNIDLMQYAASISPAQPAHPRSFDGICILRRNSDDTTKPASAQVWLELRWSHMHSDQFSHDTFVAVLFECIERKLRLIEISTSHI
ncbi:hypothetical protein DPMN_160484 [Dreissena polymorpha]|uniref:Uncharacterized protein n=1 Tax=Dreissena polymorpha TaxID=45954 RepID=A0A9D4ERB0_DREPO|nr:hypothetical protein DPMN_160484 [Dreissena polymorpha]